LKVFAFGIGRGNTTLTDQQQLSARNRHYTHETQAVITQVLLESIATVTTGEYGAAVTDQDDTGIQVNTVIERCGGDRC